MMSWKTPNKQTEDTDAAEDRNVLKFKVKFILGCQGMWEQQQPEMKVSDALNQYYF